VRVRVKNLVPFMGVRVGGVHEMDFEAAIEADQANVVRIVEADPDTIAELLAEPGDELEQEDDQDALQQLQPEAEWATLDRQSERG
jgi:hypothetical protein